MPQFKRRQFLHMAGSTLAALGLNQLQFQRQAHLYGQALAQSTPRKLALLVGVNQYSQASRVSPLNGCLTDVEMQYELLVHRYGFNPNDIVMLADEDASRDRILNTFESHLIDQARAGDVVVFHFSGHGSRVFDPEPIPILVTPTGRGYNGTLVAHDARDRTQTTPDVVDDIMGKTLFLLTKALQTETVTTIFDCCYSGGLRQELLPGFAYRTLDRDGLRPSDQELNYQDQWRQRLGLSPEDLQALRSLGIAKGVTLGSAQKSQLATDAYFDGFSAGAFTYTLTRYLWQLTRQESLNETFSHLTRQTRDVAQSAHIEQDPVAEVKPNSTHRDRPLYFLSPPTPAAEAVLRHNRDGQLEFWLGGIAPQSLAAFQSGARFNLIDNRGHVIAQIEQTNRQGLVGYGRIPVDVPSNAVDLTQGRLLREKIRGVPANATLRIGLHDSLGDEQAMARSRLELWERFAPVVVGQGDGPHYVLGRMSDPALTQAIIRHGTAQGLGAVGSVGLFTPGLSPISGSFGSAADESVDTALDRLRPRLKMLLAGYILRTVINNDTTRLNVAVTVETPNRQRTFAHLASRSAEEAGVMESGQGQRHRLTPNTEIQIRVTNHEPRSLYVGIIVIDSSGALTVVHPLDWQQPEAAARLPGNGTSIAVPQRPSPLDPNRNYCINPDSHFSFCVSGPAGFFEVLVLASTDPLRDALKGLQEIATEVGSRSGDPLGLAGTNEDRPLEVMGQLLGDLDAISRGNGIPASTGTRAVDTENLAALSLMLEVVEPTGCHRSTLHRCPDELY